MRIFLGPMKNLLIALFIASLGTTFAAKPMSNGKESAQWNLSESAYGQFRLVPSEVIPHVASIREWNGPWSEFKTFVVQLGFSKGQQTFPGNFHFVDPSIGLQGSNSTQTESDSTTVRLFSRESTEDDIKVIISSPPAKIQLNQEYLVAVISGEDSIVTWKVFVRFTAETPSYVRK